MSEAAAAVVAVRSATLADLEFLVEGNAAMALETENLVLNKDTLRLGCAAMLNDRSKGFYLMADCDGVTAGQLMVTYEHSDWRNGKQPATAPTYAPSSAPHAFSRLFFRSRYLQARSGPPRTPLFPACNSRRFRARDGSNRRWIQSVYTVPHLRQRGVYMAVFNRVQDMGQGAPPPPPPPPPSPSPLPPHPAPPRSVARRVRHTLVRREPQLPRTRHLQKVRDG
jgi:hypothetical protein